MKFIELAQNLKNSLKNVYLLTGEDDFLKQMAYKMIKKASKVNDFDEVLFNDENFNLLTFQEAFISSPLMSEYKLIYLKDVNLVEKDKKQLENFLLNLPSSTCLVINIKSKINVGEIVDCSYLEQNALVKYVKNEALKANKEIEQGAVNLLIELCGQDLMKITKELSKLLNYCDNKIVSSDVTLLVTPTEEYQVYELSEALGNKNKEKSMKLLALMLEKKENSLLGLITNHFRRICFSGLSDYTNEQLAEMFNVKPYAILKARNQSKYFSKVQLKNILAWLEDVDYMIKSGKMQSENAFYYLTFKILYC